MVWPILISVAVTPRISADSAPAESVRQATAPSAPIQVTKRIGIPPLVSSAAPKGGAARPVSGSSEREDAMTQLMTPILFAAGAASNVRGLPQPAAHNRFAVTAFDISDFTPVRWNGTMKNR